MPDPQAPVPDAGHAAAERPAPLAVIDSNIWVDILVFDDPLSRPIRSALEQGRLRAVIDADCREELRRVLDYPQFARKNVDCAAALAWLDGHTTPHLRDGNTPPARKLPVCKDPDDQKFMELARDAGAVCLITKDKALLRLAGKLRSGFGIAVIRPADFPVSFP